VSHYTVDYSGLEGDAKRDAAIEDIIGYLGLEKFRKISAILSAAIGAGEEDDAIRFTLSFVGVQGYPATAWLEKLRAEKS
jgi:hypothetical protein